MSWTDGIPSENQRLLDRVADLERRIEALEEASKQQWPFPWPFPEVPTVPDPIDCAPNACAVCGLRFEGVMGYVCPRGDCPSAVSYTAGHLMMTDDVVSPRVGGCTRYGR